MPKMKKLHSLFITYNGALEPLIQSQGIPYLKGIADMGVKVSLLSFEKREDRRRKQKILSLKETLSRYDIDWYRLPYLKASPIGAVICISLGILYSVYLVLTKGVNVVHARDYLPAAMALVSKWIFGVKLIFDMRGFSPEEYVDAGTIKKNGFIFKLLKIVERRLLLSSDEIVTLTSEAADIIRDFPYLKAKKLFITTIPCCADLSRFRPTSIKEKSELVWEYGLVDKFILVYSGSVGTWYELEEMVSFFRTLKKKIPKAHLLVLNYNDHTSVLKVLSKEVIEEENFTILEITPDRMPAFISLANVGICFLKQTYSKKASSPTKIAEYLGCGLPVVINSGVGDSDELIREAKLGVVLDTYDQTSYTEAVDRLLELVKEKSLPDRCRKCAEIYLSLDFGILEYREVYTRIGDIRE